MSRWTDTDRAEARKAAEADLIDQDRGDLVSWCHVTHPHDMVPRHAGLDDAPRRPRSRRKVSAWDPTWIDARAATAPLWAAGDDPDPALMDALTGLPGDQGRYCWVVYGLGWSTREAAAYFGVSQSTVTRKARAGLAALRDADSAERL